MLRLRVACISVAVVFVFGLAACGSSNKTTKTGKSNPPVALIGAVNDHGTKDITTMGMSPSIEIEADDNYFGPTYVKAAPGATVTIELRNEGKAEHTFTIDGTSVDQDLKPDQKADVRATIPQDGALQWHCRFHGSAGMQGAFFTAPGAKITNAGGSGPTDASSPSGYYG